MKHQIPFIIVTKSKRMLNSTSTTECYAFVVILKTTVTNFLPLLCNFNNIQVLVLTNSIYVQNYAFAPNCTDHFKMRHFSAQLFREC